MIGLWRWVQRLRGLAGGSGSVRSFGDVVREQGVGERVDAGVSTIPTAKVVGSVWRADGLRSNFLSRAGRAATTRFLRVSDAVRQRKLLPPILVYMVRVRRRPAAAGASGAPGTAPQTEYYVLDGHRRVAAAKQLGQEHVEAHVIDYTGGGASGKQS